MKRIEIVTLKAAHSHLTSNKGGFVSLAALQNLCLPQKAAPKQGWHYVGSGKVIRDCWAN